MPAIDTLLTNRSLTKVVNEAKSPRSFLKRLLWSSEQTVPTVTVDIPTIDRERKIAPLIRRGAAGILVDGGDEGMRSIKPAHIRVKRKFAPTDLFGKRRPGQKIYTDTAEINAKASEYIAREMAYTLDDIDNTEELLCGMALTGTISWTDGDNVAFTATTPRDAGMSITLAAGDAWDTATAKVDENFQTAQELLSDAVSLGVTDAICGANAAAAFKELLLTQARMSKLLDTRRMESGTPTFNTVFMDSGAIFLGTLTNGIRIWRYGKQLPGPDGVMTDLIRTDWVEFVSVSQSSERVMYYGAVEDLDAADGRMLETKRFTKTWREPDPSGQMHLTESNPLPIHRRPNSWVSMKVTNV